jgi:hypothetical protein
MSRMLLLCLVKINMHVMLLVLDFCVVGGGWARRRTWLCAFADMPQLTHYLVHAAAVAAAACRTGRFRWAGASGRSSCGSSCACEQQAERPPMFDRRVDHCLPCSGRGSRKCHYRSNPPVQGMVESSSGIQWAAALCNKLHAAGVLMSF